MLYKIDSKQGLAQIGRERESAAQKRKSGVLAVHDLRAKMLEKSADFQGECRIYGAIARRASNPCWIRGCKTGG